ncbi:MAG: hypothetical protein WAQ25_00140 [Candidatus Saccharimonas sp.]
MSIDSPKPHQLPISYTQQRRESEEFFGSFFSVTKNIWFRKYRQSLHTRFDFQDSEAVVWFTLIYIGVVMVTGFICMLPVVALVSILYAYFDGQHAYLTAPIAASVSGAILFIVSYYGVWPLGYAYMRRKGIVKKK